MLTDMLINNEIHLMVRQFQGCGPRGVFFFEIFIW